MHKVNYGYKSQIILKGEIHAELIFEENQYEYQISLGKVQLRAYVFCHVKKRLQVVEGMLVWKDIGHLFIEFLALT